MGNLEKLVVGVVLACVGIGSVGFFSHLLLSTTGTGSANDLSYTLGITIGGFAAALVSEIVRRQFSST